MAPRESTKTSSATTPKDNGYDPQCGAYDPAYSGDLTEQDTEFATRDARVDATRNEFKHQDKPNKPEAWSD